MNLMILKQGDLNSYYRFLNELGERFHASHHLVSWWCLLICWLYIKTYDIMYKVGIFLEIAPHDVLYPGDEDGSVSCHVAGKMPRVTSNVRWMLIIWWWSWWWYKGWYFMFTILNCIQWKNWNAESPLWKVDCLCVEVEMWWWWLMVKTDDDQIISLVLKQQ